MRNVRAWIGLMLVALLVMMVGIGGEAKAAEPSDALVAELSVGSVSAVVGAISAYVGFTLFQFAAWVSCYSDNHCSWDFDAVSTLALPVGMILGATLGVSRAGEGYHIQGNVPAALVGAIVGQSVGIGISFIISSYSLERVFNYRAGGWKTYLLVGSLTTAVGATIGYNIGAKMRSDKSQPAALNWYLPLIAVRF